MNLSPSFWQQFVDVWEKGGSLMPVLAALSLYAYYVGFDLWFRLRDMLPSRKDAKEISRVTAQPEKAKGRLRSILYYCLEAKGDTQETRRRFEETRATDASFLGRRIRFLLVLTSAAPLLGLLGTVNGMLLTFDGLSRQIGRKMDLVASGISEALVTTQAGLLIAIPAFALAHLVSRRRHEWLYLLRRAESHALQGCHPVKETR
jgi:biopolymer transport protein ExbB